MEITVKKPANVKSALVGSCPPYTGIWKTKAGLSAREKEHLLNYIKIAIEFQDWIGLDIICEGELARSLHPSAPEAGNAYINYFAQFLNGVDENIIVKNKISLSDEAFINEDYQHAKQFTQKPVKINIPGPISFIDRIKNDYYKFSQDYVQDYATALKKQIISLIDLGVEYIHIDEPNYLYHYVFTKNDNTEAYKIKHDIMKYILDVDKKNTKFIVHCCLFNTYGEDIAHHNESIAIENYYLSPSAHQLDAIDNIDYLSFEKANKKHIKFRTDKLQTSVMFGVVSISNYAIEAEKQLIQDVGMLIHENAHKPNGVIISPNCGIKHFNFGLAAKKIGNMVKAVDYFK